MEHGPRFEDASSSSFLSKVFRLVTIIADIVMCLQFQVLLLFRKRVVADVVNKTGVFIANESTKRVLKLLAIIAILIWTILIHIRDFEDLYLRDNGGNLKSILLYKCTELVWTVAKMHVYFFFYLNYFFAFLLSCSLMPLASSFKKELLDSGTNVHKVGVIKRINITHMLINVKAI